MPTLEELKQRGDVISAPGSEIKTVANATGYSAPIGPQLQPSTMPLPESPKTLPTGAPETMPAAPDQNLENIRKVFGQQWTPSPTFTPEMQKQGVYGAVRIAGTPSVYTIGSGGKSLSAEDYQKQFGTSAQEGIVSEITPEQAQRLGIVLPTKKATEDITPSAVVSSEDARTKDKDLKTQLAEATSGIDNVALTKSYDDIQKNIDTTIADLEKRRKEETDLINKQFDILATQQAGEQKKEVGTTTSTLARIGGFLGQSASSQGALLNLSQSHRQEQTVLEAKRASALQAANNAINDKQFDLARDKVTEVKNLNNEIEARRNKFFDQAMDMIQEQRQNETVERQKKESEFKMNMDRIEKVAPTVIESIADLPESEAINYIYSMSKDLGIDPNLLMGEVNSLVFERKENEKKEIISLAQKYPTAGIDPNSDTFLTASDKIRNSKEYKLDIMKAEADLANTRSLISQRASDAKVDYSDPILKLYANATGKIVTSPSEARGVMGYADSLLSEKEIVPDDFSGPLLDNQIRSSEAKKLISDAFVKLPKEKGFGTIEDNSIWQWLSTTEAQSLTDEQKKTYIMEIGKNPEDFGIW